MTMIMYVITINKILSFQIGHIFLRKDPAPTKSEYDNTVVGRD